MPTKKRPPVQKAAVKKRVTPRRTAAQVEAQFNAFKQEVIEKTWEYPSGCEEGKRDFLRDLGLKAPKRRCRFTVDLSIQTSDEEETQDELWDVIGDALKGYGYDFNIDLCEFTDYDG